MWNPKIIDDDKSLYLAIADALEHDIRGGLLKPGQKMPTHRELADIIGVNVTTVTRAYKEAERRGLITGTVGRGTYITADYGTDSAIMRIGEKPSQMIDLGPVLPLYHCEPDISKLIEKLVKDRQVNRFLRYSDPLGLPEHRETGAHWVKRFGITANSDNIVICAGAQHALTCCLSSLFEAGDRIAVDCLTYSGFKAVAKSLSIKLEPIPIDQEGMTPESLEAACRRNPVQGLYVMPSVQNPTNASMSLTRRKELAVIAERNNLIVIEDDIYSFTSQNTLPALSTLVPENSIYIAGVSKAFYAGLRVSFVVAPKRLRLRIAKAVLNTIWMAPPLNTAIVSECIKDGTADAIISAKLQEAARRFAMAREKLSGYSFAGPSSGYYIWLSLPAQWSSGNEFEMRARDAGVNIFGAEKFIVGSMLPPPAVRISLSGPETNGELVQGLNIIAGILAGEFLDLNPIL
jgi:DNA-binding transcriptional MocR family regulator